MTPDEAYLNVLDSLRAVSPNSSFVSQRDVAILAIALQRALTHESFDPNPRKYLYRDARLVVLRRLFEQDPDTFTTSKQLLASQVVRLIELLFGFRVSSLTGARVLPLRNETVLAVQFAASGVFEQWYTEEGKFIRKPKEKKNDDSPSPE